MFFQKEVTWHLTLLFGPVLLLRLRVEIKCMNLVCYFSSCPLHEAGRRCRRGVGSDGCDQATEPIQPLMLAIQGMEFYYRKSHPDDCICLGMKIVLFWRKDWNKQNTGRSTGRFALTGLISLKIAFSDLKYSISFFGDSSCWEIIIIKQIHTFTSNILFEQRRVGVGCISASLYQVNWLDKG